MINQDVSGETEEIELRHPNPPSISPTSKKDPPDEPVQPTLYVTRAGLEQYLDKNSSSDSPIKQGFSKLWDTGICFGYT